MTPCILHTKCKTKDGYGKLKVDGKSWTAHRYAYTVAHGEIPEGLVVMHQCDNRLCVNVEHLTLGTHQDNMADRDTKGRQAKADKHGRSKLTVDDVKAIRESTLTQGELAKVYGVSQASISSVIRYETWRNT